MKYTAYLGIKYYEDQSNRDFIEMIAAVLKSVGIETVCVARDIEKWGEKRFTPDELMKITFHQIDKSDFVILEMSEKGVGLGIEAGYAVAKKKTLIVLIKNGKVLSATMQGIADFVISYDQPQELGEKIISKLDQ